MTVDARERSDSDLVQLTRSGDSRAFAELWSRHSRSAVAVARSITTKFDADDLVSEAYLKVFNAINRGGGPTGAFRPYLFTAIRNTAVSWSRTQREDSLESADAIADPRATDATVIAALDRSLTAKAFRTLPTRWQEVLWYTEVEEMSPQEMAPLLGLKANSVAALTYRAREGLRQAWIQAHIDTVASGSDHQWTLTRLGQYARGSLSARNLTRLEEHLTDCAKCTLIASEAKEIGSTLTLVLLPLSVGVTGAVGYAAWVAAQRPAGSAAGVPSAEAHMSPPAETVTTTVATTTRGRRKKVAAVAAALLIIAALAVPIVQGLPVAQTSEPLLPAADGDNAAKPGAPQHPHEGQPGDPQGVVSGEPAPSPTAVAPESAPSTPGQTSPSTGVVTPPGGVQQPPANPTVTPTLGNVDTGGGLWFPVASGQAPAGSTVRVSNGSGAAVTLTVGPAGTWTTSQLDGFPAGPGTVTVTISTPSGATVTQSGSFTVNTPALSLTGGNAQFTMTVAGVANGRYQTYADGSTGWGDVLTDSSGTVTRTTTWYASPGAHTVSVRATSGARTGPMVSGTVTITR